MNVEFGIHTRIPNSRFQIPHCPAVPQPPLPHRAAAELTAVIGGLAIGGAERIVIDWAVRVQAAWPVHIVVLRDSPHEWRVPEAIRVTRLGGVDVETKLTGIGREIAQRGSPACLCHLLTDAERRALAAGGAAVVPVVHNARAGWLEGASTLHASPHVIAVSQAAADDLRHDGCAAVSVIRHIPRPRRFANDARAAWRRAWRIPERATVAGMIGAVKPQKDYPFAIRLLRRLLDDRDLYLVIVGGPVGRHGRDAWFAALDEMARCGVRHRLAMPGFVPDAAACLPAFDLLLNTSRYEGTSIATLDALVNGVPVVASRVGGQGELPAEGLTLVDRDAPLDDWAAAAVAALDRSLPYPAWTGFSSFRLWTLAHLAADVTPALSDRVLFVTANLNAGGAQRSLVNLATRLRRVRFDVAVTGDSTADYFLDTLLASDVAVWRTAASRDPFDHAERLVQRISADRTGIVCFWNVDPKIKLLVTKALAHAGVVLVDISPGPSSFDEMRRAADFARLIAFDETEYSRRLDRMVSKFHGPVPPACAAKLTVIPNGVPAPPRAKASYELAGAPRVVVNGRIAPTKFLVEIVEAMAIVRATIPTAELHVFGSAEPRHAAYAERVEQIAGESVGRTVFFHGASGATVEALAEFDAFVVLGQHQGSPNALLEALAAGLPCIANDDGGTKELVEDDRTGLLLADRAPTTLGRAIVRVLTDRAWPRGLAAPGAITCCGRSRSTPWSHAMNRCSLRSRPPPRVRSSARQIVARQRR
jgi:glycosyltransferase involved in cell wall biosynthesis